MKGCTLERQTFGVTDTLDFFHERDIVDKDLEIRSGDYFSYGEVFFEITSAIVESNVYGQIEHSIGIKVVGKQARKGAIDFTTIGPKQKGIMEDQVVQEEFEQQRGQKENTAGETNDKRALQEKGKVEPIDEPVKVKKQKDENSATTESFFYGDR